MQLVNMDVERHGSRGPLSLGPLSPGLNALCGPAGSGKTTLLYWLRQLAQEDQPLDYGSSHAAWSHSRAPLRGSVEVANRGLRFRLGNPSTSQHFYSPNNPSHASTPFHSPRTNLTSGQRAAFVALASTAGVEDSEAGLESVAQRLGLDVHPTTAQQPEREHLLARQREVAARLQQLQQLTTSRETLLASRDALQRELHASHSQPVGSHRPGDLPYQGYPSEHRRYDDRFAIVEADLRRTEARLAELDLELSSLQAELKLLETSRHSVAIDDSYRVQLQHIDERLTRWRQTLRDLKGHRNQIEHEATDARLDRQVGDQLSSTKEPDPRAPLRSLEAQILSARNQLDALVDRYSVFQDRRSDPAQSSYPDRNISGDRRQAYDVRQDAEGRTHIAYHDNYRYPDASNLPDTLRSMQKDLYEACQQLARHESRAANETLKQQSQQLQRCETELLHSVEKLIEERAALLRKIADQYQLSAEQLSLAFGDWCNCHDHNHLHDWLLNESEVKTTHIGTDPLARQRLLEKVEALEHQRKQINLHAEDCRRQMRDAELYRINLVDRRAQPLGRSAEIIQRELNEVLSQLDQDEDRERLLREAEDLRQSLATLRPIQISGSPFRDLVNRHIAGLMGGRESVTSRRVYSNAPEVMQRRYDLVDGIVYDPERRIEAEVPAALVRVAQRLAIAEGMAARAEPIPLLIDESLDRLSREDQATAIAYLGRAAATGQQVVVLTGNERIAELVRQHHGWVGYLKSNASSAVDVNRHLAAVANDYEAAKWYSPVIQSESPSVTASNTPFYLTERSRVEESPSIDEVLAARLRAVGIDRVGDLLDVDPQWLAEQLRQDGVGKTTVASWQAEARLLCSVRQLRPFDARLLVSIGVRTPQQLADMHPSQLLDRVERFVATDRGRRLLRSGSSYELSRITTWIASAKGGAGRFQRSSFADHGPADEYRNGYPSQSPAGRQSARNGAHLDDSNWGGWTESLDYDDDLGAPYPSNSRRAYDAGHDRNYGQLPSSLSDATHLAPADDFYEDDFDSLRRDRGSDRRRRPSSSSRAGRTRSAAGSSRDNSNGNRPQRSAGVGERVSRNGTTREARPSRSPREERHSRGVAPRAEAIKLADAQFSREDAPRLKFYLELASPVVDAPSIGPRMVTRLEKFGIQTVDQLLAANAEALADKLNLRRIDSATIRAWQEQARLVCRIPNLRGHDAQLLVACNLTSPEELAGMQAASVLEQVSMVAESSEGQRILRGSKQPDLAEVSDWIHWASQCRSLNAA